MNQPSSTLLRAAIALKLLPANCSASDVFERRENLVAPVEDDHKGFRIFGNLF
jgi:hypothetical protein